METEILLVIKVDLYNPIVMDEEYFRSDLFKVGTRSEVSHIRRKLGYSVSTLADCPGPAGMTISPRTQALSTPLYRLCLLHGCSLAILNVVATCS